MASSSRLFKPVALGQASIHRVAMAPLTRFRAEDGTQAPKNIVPECEALRARASCAETLTRWRHDARRLRAAGVAWHPAHH